MGVARECGNRWKISLLVSDGLELFSGGGTCVLELPVMAISCSPAAEGVAMLLILRVGNQGLRQSANDEPLPLMECCDGGPIPDSGNVLDSGVQRDRRCS